MAIELTAEVLWMNEAVLVEWVADMATAGSAEEISVGCFDGAGEVRVCTDRIPCGRDGNADERGCN